MEAKPEVSLKQMTLEQLKSEIQKKLKKVKFDFQIANLKLTNSLKDHAPKIQKLHNKYFYDLKDKSISYIKNKETMIKEKEILNKEYFDAIRNVKRVERFEKNMSEIILDSMKNYNNFITNKLPFYKKSCHQFLKNQEDKLCNNNIYSKLTKKQIDKIYEQLDNKNLKYFISGKYPVNMEIVVTENCIENSLVLSSTTHKINFAEINKMNDSFFPDFFNNVREEKKKFIAEIIFKNCELKTSELSKIPLAFHNLSIIDSKINTAIFDKMSFQNLIKINLDNAQIDSTNFDKLLQTMLKVENKSLKEFSAKHNCISRVSLGYRDKKELNKLLSLEIFNLAYNNIYKVDIEILDYMPNLKIFDLSNNILLHQTNCKELIKNCKGIVLLLKNLVISKENIYNFYLDYYRQFLSEKINDKFPLQYINFDSLFYTRNNQDILAFDYSFTKTIENISELNLSSCSLDNKAVENILINCISIKNNLSSINISFNLLSEEIFDILIEDKINAFLKNLKELDLSYNLINFKHQENYKDPKLNQFVKFLDCYSQLEFLNLKSTPFEEKINEFIKTQIKLYYEKKSKGEEKIKIGDDLKEIKDIIDSYCLQINQKFHFVINDLITSKYSSPKRMKQILPILDKNIKIDNLIQEKKEGKEK